jgi:hypothetical protein
MISTILELSVEAGVSVPNIEDLYVIYGPNAQIGRKNRWEAFEKWYVGNELHENPLKAMPTVARIMFTDWEKKHVKDDSKLREIVKQRQNENSQSDKKKSIAGMPTAPPKPVKRMATSDLNLTVTKSSIDEDEIVKLYEIEVNKAGGDAFRCDVLKKQVKSVLTSRNLSMLRLFWPPSGSSKPTSQYLFPRLGLIHPKFEEQVKRFKVFPSKSPETYSIEEVMAWYRSQELVEDDEINVRNELEGQKHQAYLNWLAEEEERMEKGRLLMVEEDILASRLRIHTKGIENDRELPLGKPRFRDFIFGRKLPGQYEDLGTKTTKFSDGSGLDNEDEVQDILEKMAKETELSLQHAKELKKKQLEDRKRKEEEDRIKQEKLERDQRIEENKDRLKRIREHLDNIKLQRKLQEEDKQRELQENDRKKDRESLLHEEYLRHEKQVYQEKKLLDEENRLMQIEDLYHHYCREKEYNQHNMIEEDVNGALWREIEMKNTLKYQNRLRELEEIYEEYEPFQFDPNKIRRQDCHYPDPDDDLLHDDEATAAATAMLKKRQSEIPQKIEWRLFAKEISDSLPEKYFVGADDSPSHFIPGGLPQLRDHSDVKVWPRSENLTDIVPSLIWSGPDANLEKKYSKLRKQSRPYTPLNPGEELFANIAGDAEPMNVLLLQNDIIDPLEQIGLSKSLIKSMKNNRYNLPTSEPVSQPTSRFPKLKPQSIPTQKRFEQPSFKEPIRYQSSTDDLRILSPSRDRAALLESASSPNLSVANPPLLPQNAHQTMASAPPALIKSLRQSKSANRMLDQIKSDREALRAFISSSSSLTDDRFYLEACRPGIRSRDSINSNQMVQNYRQTLLQSFENKPLHQGSAILTAVKESMDAGPMSDSVSFSLPLPSKHPSSLTQNDAKIDHSVPVSGELQKDGRQSLCNSQELSLHPTSLHPSDLILSPKHRPLAHEDVESQSVVQPPFQPPYSRKLFGIRGQQKRITELHPAILANEIVSESAALKKGTKVSAQLETCKSKQRHEYSSLLRKTIETSRKNYSASDVNFADNKGL